MKANRAIAKIAQSGDQITPAAEWLIDNYHLVDMQIREIGVDLPPGYYAQLPKLADAIVRTLTRVFFTKRHLLQWVTAAQATEAHV